MKALSGGLTFVNITTIAALLLGILSGGLNQLIVFFALLIGAAAGIAAYLGTDDPEARSRVASAPDDVSPRRRYASIPIWILGGFFVIYAVRAFCWLFYIDGEEWKIQSANNLGDLALHITYIKNLANGVTLWPDNPIYVFSHLRYPVGVDFFNALLQILHFDLPSAFTWVGLLAAAATFYALLRWGGPFGIAGFLFNGGVAGFQFLSSATWFQFLDYQGDKTIAWKSIPLSMFTTQRGLLYAIPAGLLLLWHWREKFFRAPAANRSEGPLPFWVELSLYASMPLFHLHTFLALSVVLLCLFILESGHELKSFVNLVRQERFAGIKALFTDRMKIAAFIGDTQTRAHILMLVAGAIIPATFFVALITDFFHAGSVVEWHVGWVMDDGDFKQSSSLAFWWLNFGLWFPLVGLLLGVSAWRAWKKGVRPGDRLPEDLAFLISAVVIFILGMVVKFAPWGWDNLKLMIWGYFIILPYLWARLIRPWPWHLRAAICVALFGSGFVTLFGGLATGGHGFANRGEVDWLGVALRKVPVEARFAAYPTYNHPLLLQGRKVVLGYPGHLWTQGFADYGKTYTKLQSLMQGEPNWRQIAAELRVRYIFWGKEERLNYPGSSHPWEKSFTVVASDPTWGTIYDLASPTQ